MNALITGTSSGLGFSLAGIFKKNGYNVYGISRSISDINISQALCDFSNLDSIKPKLDNLLDVNDIDYVILNAGILGKINLTSEISINEYYEIFNINCLSNKIILDFLLKNKNVKNVIAISSGASLKTYIGWSLYCCSKACLNQLISSYSDEYKETHFVSLAPSIVKTKMQDYIYSQDELKFPSLKKFKDLYSNMQSPEDAANNIYNNLNIIKDIKSGSFFDIRTIDN